MSAAPPPASTIASIRASWSASARATPNGTQWVDSFQGKGWTDTVSVAAYGASRRAASMPMRWRATPIQQPAAAADPDPRPAAAHRQRQHRRQPVPGPGRDRLSLRRLCAGGGDASRRSRACRPRASTQNAFTRMGRQLAQPQRGAADDHLAAHGARRRPRRRHRRWAASARSTSACGWAGCTNTPTPAGRSRRRSPARRPAPFTVYGATPQRDAAVIGFSASTNIADSDAALPALRRRDRLGHRQPHAHRPACA